MNIQLTDERIDAMRDHVLSAVDDDIQQRGRRGRKVLAGGAGALVLATVLGLTIPSLTGGPMNKDMTASQTADSAGGAEALPMPGPADMDGADAGVSDLSRTTEDYAAKAAPESLEAEGIEPFPPLTAPGKNREVVTTGSANVEVGDPAKAADRFTTWVEKRGGRVDGRSESRDEEDHTSAHLTARIPSKHVSAAIAALRAQGEVKSVNLQRDDVTAQGADLDGRIKALKVSIERLEGILQRAGSSSEVIEAETALSERQQELQSLQLQRRSLDDQVSLSTLSVSFEQERKPGSVAPGGFRGGLIAGWNALVDTVEAVVTAAGAAVPWLGLGLVLAFGWWIVRRVRR